MGYFRILLNRDFPSKAMRKPGTISEKSTNPGKYTRTRNFTPARDKIDDFHLGHILLRSARSIPDVSAFIRRREPTDAMTSIP